MHSSQQFFTRDSGRKAAQTILDALRSPLKQMLCHVIVQNVAPCHEHEGVPSSHALFFAARICARSLRVLGP